MKKLIIILFLFIILIAIFLKLRLNRGPNKFLRKEKLKVIKLIWYRRPNGGDYFGKWILEKIGLKVEYSEAPDIMICGSILGYSLLSFTYVIFMNIII